MNITLWIPAIGQSRPVPLSEGNKEPMSFSTSSTSNSALKINLQILMIYCQGQIYKAYALGLQWNRWPIITIEKAQSISNIKY